MPFVFVLDSPVIKPFKEIFDCSTVIAILECLKDPLERVSTRRQDRGSRKSRNKKYQGDTVKHESFLSVETEARSDFTSTLDGTGIFTHTTNPLAWRWLDFMITTGAIGIYLSPT